eukprot:CAMPEP_0182474492 /NCGR_PEP_ID=MMETSP1319-20130603/25748_1 /TAXON_ID=172717 /ORGANISM="Bolidomonas pacifica, Strain RCC208" /LENGTH=172 /DNA_ID=CAMNT_0024675389 /DNA_START=90 /DNA_END=604 /DNA_ORIENTATION=-
MYMLFLLFLLFLSQTLSFHIIPNRNPNRRPFLLNPYPSSSTPSPKSFFLLGSFGDSSPPPRPETALEQLQVSLIISSPLLVAAPRLYVPAVALCYLSQQRSSGGEPSSREDAPGPESQDLYFVSVVDSDPPSPHFALETSEAGEAESVRLTVESEKERAAKAAKAKADADAA